MAKAKPPRETRGVVEEEAVGMGELGDVLGFLIRRAQLWVFQDFAKLLAPLQIRPADYAVLSIIEANAGLSQIALANTLEIERAHLVRVLHRLENRNLLTRAPSASDRRSHSLQLTDHGRTVLAKSHGLVAEQEKRLAQRLGTDRYSEIKRAFQVFMTG
jgi:DNA-binding MarR family transcriptional regulator